MVYITSDLFGPNTTRDRPQDNATNYWPTMTNDQHVASLGKRKRLAGDEGPQMNIPRQQRSSPSRDGTRVHLYSTPPYECSNNLSYALFPSRPHDYTSERRPLKMPKRLSPKAGLVKTPSHLMDMDLDLPSPCQRNDVQRHIPPVSDLRSCHACNKAPKRKTELENYLDCRRCEGRTCFICARQCAGCSKAICKKCIVEVGEEGDAWCLDCYSRHINA